MYCNVVLFHFLAKGKEQSSRRHHLLGGVSRAVFIIVNFFYFQPAHTLVLVQCTSIVFSVLVLVL